MNEEQLMFVAAKSRNADLKVDTEFLSAFISGSVIHFNQCIPIHSHQGLPRKNRFHTLYLIV